MARRKLNKQQRGRIADKHSATLADTGDCLQGVVTAHHGGEVEVVAADSAAAGLSGTAYRCHVRANLPAIVCGDRVLWRPPVSAAEGNPPSGVQTGVVEALQQRASVINRPRPYSEPKPVAANIDLIVLVVAPRPAPIINLIDRYLIAAENAGINAVLLINKVDLLSSPEYRESLHELTKLGQLYRELGYPVYYYHANISANTGELPATAATLFDAAAVLGDKTSILVGQSGVGKSSIINKLCGAQRAATGDVSSANEKGRHTTTNAQMYFLQNHQQHMQGAIIDSPGIREFALWHLSQQDIIDGMPEFRAYAHQCRFRDCEHGRSAGCALQQAFDEGKIPASRIASYQHILDAQKP